METQQGMRGSTAGLAQESQEDPRGEGRDEQEEIETLVRQESPPTQGANEGPPRNMERKQGERLCHQGETHRDPEDSQVWRTEEKREEGAIAQAVQSRREIHWRQTKDC